MTRQPAAPPASRDPNEQENTLQSAFAGARLRFTGLIPIRIQKIESLLQEAKAGPDPSAALSAIADIVHQFSGTATTLGLPQIGMLSEELEMQIKDGLRGSQSPQSVLASADPMVESLLDELEDAFFALDPDPTPGSASGGSRTQ